MEMPGEAVEWPSTTLRLNGGGSAPRGEDCQSLASDPESLRSYGSQIHRVTRDAESN